MNSGDSRFKHMMRNAAILLGVFLLGLTPPLVRTIQLNADLAEARAQLRIAEARDLASLSYLEVTRNNFGIASQHASQMFDRLGDLSASAEEPARSAAATALGKRDTLMKQLATADAAARSELQDLVGKLIPAAKPPAN